jgi:phospholipase C
MTEYPGAGMTYWEEKDLPFYYSLATSFPLASRWFCSCLGPTFPNRRFLVSGTAHGLIDDVEWGLTDYPPAGTIFDLLTAHGISWANYHNKPFARTLLKSLLGKRGLSFARRVGLFFYGLLPQLEQFAIGELQFCADMYPRGFLRTWKHARPLGEFFERVREGTLPAVAIVDPDFGSFSEEDPQDVQVGESFAAAVIDEVMKGIGWPYTLLIWLYDEHCGYYDHVQPPPAPAPDDVPAQSLPERHPWLGRLPVLKKKFAPLDTADAGPRTYDRFGFRVPAVIVSPFARPGFVSQTVYDHTSILRLIEEKWNLPAMTRRDAEATSPAEALDFDSAPAFLEPPALATPARPDAWRRYLR